MAEVYINNTDELLGFLKDQEQWWNSWSAEKLKAWIKSKIEIRSTMIKWDFLMKKDV